MNEPLKKQNRFATIVLLCLAAIVGCGCSSDATNDPVLVITTDVFTGNNSIRYDLAWGDRKASADLVHEYGAPTGESSTSGNLAAIYALIADAAPTDPDDYQTTDALLAVFSAHGWELVERAIVESHPPKTAFRTVETLRFRQHRAE
ncbi:MAG: hypothetical protein ACYTF9_04075 [Planctomycetota bacterium]|jgi:hypothetical protein